MRALIAACVVVAGMTVAVPAQASTDGDTGRAVTYPVVVDGFGTHTSRTLDPVRITDGGVSTVSPRKLTEESAQERAARRTTSARAPIAQHVYVAVATDSGAIGSTDAQLATMIDNGLDWWKAQAGSAITSFDQSAIKRFKSGLGTASSRCGLGSDPESLWDKAWDQYPHVDFSAAGNHLVVIVAEQCGNAGASGLGTVGDSLASGGLVTVPDETDIFPSVITHELGHNFGLEHANLDSASAGCTQCGYLNLYSVMGLAVGTGGDPLTVPRLDSAYRAQLGISIPGHVDRLSTGATVVKTISSTSAPTGQPGLEVTVGATSYWLDYRSGVGADSDSYYSLASGTDPIGVGYIYPAGVTVEEQATDPVPLTGPEARATSLMAHAGSGSFGVGDSFGTHDFAVQVDAVASGAATITVTASSDDVVVTTPLALIAGTPTISGTPQVGRTLSAAPGRWTPTPTISYQWYSNGSPIRGADNRVLRLAAGQRGRVISVRATGTLGGLRASRISSPTAKVRAGTLATSKPRITGKAKVGRKLTAKHGHWTAGTSFHYRWFANGKRIPHATHRTLTLARKVKGKRITVKVTGTKRGYVTAARTSAKTHKVKR